MGNERHSPTNSAPPCRNRSAPTGTRTGTTTPRDVDMAAVQRLVAALSDSRVKTLWTQCPSIGSRSNLYALIGQNRPNRPTRAQMLELLGLTREWEARVAAVRAEFERLTRNESRAA